MRRIPSIQAGSRNFPSRLTHLDDPVNELFYQGDLSLLETPGIAIIGTRTPTQQGREVAAKLASMVVSQGYSVISGLAAGIDQVAHQAALEGGGKTIAIIPSGVNHIPYQVDPGLLEDMSTQGLILSEYPPGEVAQEHYFVDRDRIQAALATVIILVETELGGGAMVTVDYARQLGKKVVVIAYDETNPQRKGNELVSSWSDVLVVKASDIIDVSFNSMVFNNLLDLT